MADLLTLTEYKNMAGIPLTDTRKDTQISALITSASSVIRSVSDRSFDTVTVASTRGFQYEGGGVLDIDDCEAVTGVSTDAGVTGADPVELTPEMWTAMPYGSPVFNYLLLSNDVLPPSPQMGFVRNLDRREYRGKAPIVYVTATWGWPSVPEDVKLATFWVIQDWLSTPKASNLTAESIEGFSRAWGRIGGQESRAVPSRALDILAQYERFTV